MRCVFCGAIFMHILQMHNAEPVIDGKCCLDCNYRIVIPARMEAIK